MMPTIQAATFEQFRDPDGDAAAAADLPAPQPARYALQPGLSVRIDARGGVLLTELGLSCENPSANGVIFGFTSGACTNEC